MENLNIGVQGRKVESWNPVDGRSIVKTVIEAHGDLDQPAQFEAFWNMVKDNEAILRSVAQYYFANTSRSLVVPPAPRAARPLIEAMKAEIKARATKMVLLDLMLPNGKKLRDTTGGECADLGVKVGAWLANLAARVPVDELVGQVLEETEVRQIYEGA